jgi:predicted HNH restriction endonuclease
MQDEERVSETRRSNKNLRFLDGKGDCISACGLNCKVCGFNFFEHFGELGRGYVAYPQGASLTEVSHFSSRRFLVCVQAE